MRKRRGEEVEERGGRGGEVEENVGGGGGGGGEGEGVEWRERRKKEVKHVPPRIFSIDRNKQYRGCNF